MTDLDPRRRFNSSERAALFLAADGKCMDCGDTLGPSWHADHGEPWSVGGATDVINGRATCPPCNLKKGSSTMAELRDWQRNASEKFYAHKSPDFLVSATPGAGKTTFSLRVAKQMIDDGVVDRVIVVVPTDALREQWGDNAGAAGLPLKPVVEATDYVKAGYKGCIVTYQQLASGAGADLARAAARRPTLAIIDEIHHAGDSRSWGDSLRNALEPCTRRLAMTGTPWRRSASEPIPFVNYDKEGKVIVDFAYEYGEAVADGVCRRIEFHTYDGEAHWTDPARAYRLAAKYQETDDHVRDEPPRETAHFSAKLSADMKRDDVSAALDAVYHPRHQWLPTILVQANLMLDELREEVPDAAGLVIAETKWQAAEYGKLIKDLTGEMPPVVVSDPQADPGSKIAKAAIDRFRKSTGRWIVAVKMISEGVDIPRLAVGVYASKTQSPLFFRQVVGRFVRVRPNEDFNARLLMPCVPALVSHARDIEEELRHQLEIEAERELQERAPSESGQAEFDFRQPLSATEATFERAILGGEETNSAEFEAAKRRCEKYGLPAKYALNLIPMFRELDEAAGLMAAPEAEAKPEPAPHRVEKMLRDEIKVLVGRLAHKRSSDPDRRDLGVRATAINGELVRMFGVRGKATIATLEKTKDYLQGELGAL